MNKMNSRKKTKSFALALRLRARAATLLIAMLCCVTGAWADHEVTIATNLSRTTYTSGDVTITFSDPGDGNGGSVIYENLHPMTISVSSGVIKSVVLRLGSYAENAECVHTSGNVGIRTISEKTGLDLSPGEDPDDPNDDEEIAVWEDGKTWVTFSSINASSVTIYSDNWVQIDEVKVTYADVVAVNGVSLSPTSAVLNVGQITTLTATVSPGDATNKAVTWSTSNPSVATVSNGVVTAQGVGTATITVTTEDGGKTATCAVTVDDPVTVAKYVGKVIAADGKVYKTLAAANKYSTASGIVAYYGSEVVETGQTYKAIAISLTNSERTDMYCGLDNTSCSGSTYGDIATALTVKNGIATTAATLGTNVAHGYSHQLYYAAKETTPAPPAGASAWSIPSIGQWNLIIKGLTGSGTNLSTSANASFSASNVNAKIPTGADGFSELNYWSCTEKDNNKMWMMQFNGSGGLANNINKKNYATQGLRTMFAFTSATPVYIVNYDANGGSDAPDEQVKDDGSNLTLSSTVPTREGYTFVGWNTAADGSGTSYAAGATYTTDDDATLYAQWLMTAMIGCEGMVIAANGKMYKTLAAANKYSTASGIVAYYGSEVVETGQTYKAIAISLTDYRYNQDFMIYCGQSGSCSGHTYGDLATALTVKNGIATQATALSTNAGHGYSHQVAMAPGNNTSPRPTGASGWTIPSIGQWNLIMKGLTGTSLSTSANAALSTTNVNAALPADATGFSQTLYWSNTEKDNSKMWTMQFDGSGGYAGNIAKNTGSYTLCRTMFAFTSATPVYVVSYDANGGSGAPDEQVKDGGSSLTLSSTVPTREGYAFAGWNTAADGSGASYAAGEAYTTDDDVTLYAQWTATPTYNLTANEGATGEFWATFYSDASNYEASEGTKVFAVNLTGTEITMTEISDAIVKSGQGVVLKSNSASITMTPTTSAGSGDWTDNSLTGTMTSITNPGNAYVLNKKDGTGVGFYRLSSGGTIGANKAYLTYSGTLAREFFLFDEATGISATLMNNEEVNGEVYDLQGRRVSQPTKGLYIVNGKKYIKK